MTPHAHVWSTPAWCAAQLGATKRGQGYRGACPVHDGDNPDALHVWQKLDPRGNPVTMITCHTQHCDIRTICAYLGIELANLYSIRPEYYPAMKHFPPARSPRIARLRHMEEIPLEELEAMPEDLTPEEQARLMHEPTPDAIAQLLLEEMIVSDPSFVTESMVAGLDGVTIQNPARAKMYELAARNSDAREMLTKALLTAHINPTRFWTQLISEQQKARHD
jgi:hypothetical protein